MKIILTLLAGLTCVNCFSQEKSSFLKKISTSISYTTEIGLQWKVNDNHKSQQQIVDEGEVRHSYLSTGIDLQLNYCIDNAALLGIGWQYQSSSEFSNKMHTVYAHFRTGDDFDTRFSKFIEADLGGSLINTSFDGIMYRIVVGIDFCQFKWIGMTPSASIYLGQRWMADFSTTPDAGGLYNLVGINIGIKIN
ncbi:hypothetical protein EI427_13640 [Flammeovirga pectinis]|uniref:Outer membrane protein beta-barrel domain-containing protein n=1 Tax=Flammeovirga pectinis TaxID=2494373 RepID=A0A3Q9FMY8_9BACT|nr:hypothetical protein [Flammeovirga pectinis]AZQ63245.1 hypothetical protein EI427_13640 [Flammeovirga pectinis]